MSKRDLSTREACILSGLWIITGEERDKLDRFFLLFDHYDNLHKDLSFSKENVCYFLSHEGIEWKVRFMSPMPRIMTAANLGLSFRFNKASNFYWVVIKEWKEGKTEAVVNNKKPAEEKVA